MSAAKAYYTQPNGFTCQPLRGLGARAVSSIDNSPAKPDPLPDFEQGFRPACEVKTGTFYPRTTFGRPGASSFYVDSKGVYSELSVGRICHSCMFSIFNMQNKIFFVTLFLDNLFFQKKDDRTLYPVIFLRSFRFYSYALYYKSC